VRTVIRLLVGSILTVWVLLSPTAAAAADWVLPLDGEPVVTRAFDPPAAPYGPGHRGVDLAGAPGQSVRAAGAGTIGYAAVLAGRGVVTVRHSDGLRTTYEPVSAAVQVGQAVQPGQPIGSLQTGHLGCPVSACLHWGLLRGEAYLDPMSLLSLGPIRLLPLPAFPDERPFAGNGAAAPAGDAVTGPAVTGPAEFAARDSTPAGRLSPAVTAVTGLAVGLVALLAPSRPP